MNEQMLETLRCLPRHTLEDLAIRALTEARIGREQRAPNAIFVAMLVGLLLGTSIAAAGFVVGAALT